MGISIFTIVSNVLLRLIIFRITSLTSKVITYISYLLHHSFFKLIYHYISISPNIFILIVVSCFRDLFVISEIFNH